MTPTSTRAPLLQRALAWLGLSGRERPRWLVVAAGIVILVAIGAWFIRRAPGAQPHFLPLFVTHYQHPALGTIEQGRRDQELLCACFTRVQATSWSAPRRHELLRQLDDLAALKPGDAAVVYLCGRSVLADGELHILAADAAPDDARTWVPFAEILTRLHRCPASHQLLIVDVEQAETWHRLGAAPGWVAHALADALAALPDERRSVLTAAGEGQLAHSLAVQGVSAFAFYVEDGLSGSADGCGKKGQRDAVITVSELAAYVAARVDRWSRINRGTRQTPRLLELGPDFPVAACAAGRASETDPPPASAEFPAWLRAERAACEADFEAGVFRRNPRALQQRAVLIADLERAARAGADPAALQTLFLQKQQRMRTPSQTPLYPIAFSLALDAPSKRPDPNLHDALVKVHAEWRTAPADEQARIQARFLTHWAIMTRDVDERARDAAVLHWLTAQPHEPAVIRWADALLHANGASEPRYVESLTVRLLADLAQRVPLADWSNTLAKQALSVAQLAEQPLREPALLPWIHADLTTAAQRQHEGEIALWAHGFVPRGRAAELLGDVEQRYLNLNRRLQRLSAAHERADRASLLLPGFLPILARHGDLQPAWEHAVHLAAELLDLLEGPPADAEKTWARLEELSAQLSEKLERLQAHCGSDRVAQLVQQCRADDANAAHWVETTSLLEAGVGWLKPGERAAVEQAAMALGQRLHAATRQLDRAEDAHEEHTPPPRSPEPADDLWRAALGCIKNDLELWQLAGLPKERTIVLGTAWARLTLNRDDVAAWTAWGQAQRDLVATVPEAAARETSLVRKERLSRFYPAREPCLAFDAGEPLPANLERQHGQLAWTWIAGRYRYQAQDFAGLGLDTPGIQAAHRFYVDAAEARGSLPADNAIRLHGPAATARLDSVQTATSLVMTLERRAPAGRMGPAQVAVLTPDERWLQATPSAVELPGVQPAGTKPLPTQVPLRIALADGAERAQTAAPHGVLLLARCDGRAYHRVVTVPLQVTPQEVDIIISANPRMPEPSLEEIRLRPGQVRQPFHVYLRNLSARPRKVVVELEAGGASSAGKAHATLRPGQVERLAFAGGADEPDARPLPAFQGPLDVKVLDAERNLALMASRRFAVSIVEPRDYVRIADARIAVAPASGDRKVSVFLQTSNKVHGPGIKAQLVMPTAQFRDLPSMSPTRELPAQFHSEPVALSAETNPTTGDDDGLVYVTVDGVPRALVVRPSAGERPGTARTDERVAVRIRAPQSMLPAERTPVTVEVDNAPPDARLEFTVAHSVGNVELVRRFATARERRIGLAPRGPDGALVFDAAIADWTLHLDTVSWQGPRVLKARLLDHNGRALQHTVHELIVDGTPPDLASFVAPPPQAKCGTKLNLIAQGSDAESDIDRVVFFLGKPAANQVPPGAPTATGYIADPNHGLWGGSVELPADHTGPLAVSVQFVNRAGLARCATTTIELLDVDPASLSPGSVAGKVLEGPRPQPGLTVILRDEHGTDRLKTRTQPDGSFQFDTVPPGRYQIFCVKPESGRRVLQPITVAPGGKQNVNLALSL